MVDAYKQKIEDLYEKFGSSNEDGLSYASVKKAEKQYGLNLLEIKGDPLWRKIIEPFASAFVIILLVAAGISVVAEEYLDGAVVMGVILINAVISWVQQYSTERVLRALKKQTEQKVSVIRQGNEQVVDAHELVPGDIILLDEGQKVPADGRLLEAENLSVNESILTGEAVPVHKHTSHIGSDTPTYKQLNMVFQGTFITAGSARALVVATGNQTEFGRIAKLAKPEGLAPMQVKINKLVSLIVKAAVGVSATIFILSLIRGLPADEALRFMLTMAVSAVPEGLPVALTVILVIAMRNMAKEKALVRSMHAIENLGLVTVIATDKTGTLTENILRVQDVWATEGVSQPMMKMYSRMSANIFGDSHVSDPLDVALREHTEKTDIPNTMKFLRQFSFSQELLMSGSLWQEGKHYELYVKGAPEHLLHQAKLSKKDRSKAESELHKLASSGSRVIAVAGAKLKKPIQNLEEFSGQLEFYGFVGVADSLRREAAGAIAEAQAAGIDVKMITGDHFETAFHIGKELGLTKHPREVFNAEEKPKLSALSVSAVNKNAVFARILPERKLHILKNLKKKNIVAMTGDGVNDVPALSSADVGVAMGSGSDIAKESGDIVLLDDNFNTIVSAVRSGRVVYANIRKMLFYLFSTSLGESLTMVGALVVGLPLPVTAIQILWINIVTDTAMVLPLGLDPAEDDVMKYTPRKVKAPLLDRIMITRLILMGATLAITTLSVFWYVNQTHSYAYAQAIAFTMLVTGQWAKAQVARSEKISVFKRILTPNPAQLIGYIVAFFLQWLVLFGPLRSVFHIPQIKFSDLLIPVAIVTSAVVLVGEVHKLITKNSKSE